MTILIQGMRRSGTTIIYDALLEDPKLRCFYEPFREDTETPGGGSGARESDPFAETRELRRHYAEDNHPGLAIEQFNWGGPRDPALEIGPELPDHCRGFLAHLLAQPAPAPDGELMIKFTRIYDKLAAVHELAPEAVLVHVVRDPRAVAASMMMGKDRKRRADYRSADSFFGERRKRKLWSSRQLADELLKRPEYTHLRRPSNAVRILMVWKHVFESTWREGQRLFGDRYVLLRNEELRADPIGAISRLYRAVGRPTPPEVTDWARGAVRPAEVPFAANDPRWGEAFATLGMREALENAGYPILAEAAAGARGETRLRGMLGRARARARRRAENA